MATPDLYNKTLPPGLINSLSINVHEWEQLDEPLVGVFGTFWGKYTQKHDEVKSKTTSLDWDLLTNSLNLFSSHCVSELILKTPIGSVDPVLL